MFARNNCTDISSVSGPAHTPPWYLPGGQIAGATSASGRVSTVRVSFSAIHSLPCSRTESTAAIGAQSLPGERS